MNANEPRIGEGARSPAAQILDASIPVDAPVRGPSASLGGDFSQTTGSGGDLDDARQRPSTKSLLRAIERLERTIVLETGAMDRNDLVGLHEFNHMKSHGLLELKRAIDACRALDPANFDEEAQAALERLREKLQRNLAGLRMHLTAVGEIASIITCAIEHHESDGTYTATRAKAESR